MRLSSKRLEEFWAKVLKTPGCWYWQGCTSGNNRGSFMVEGRRYVPTEVMLAIHGQPREGGLLILHTCDNPACVNPEHLYWGSQTDNMRDRSERHPGWAKKSTDPVTGKPRWYCNKTLAFKRSVGG